MNSYFNLIYQVLFITSSITFFIQYFRNKLYKRNYLFNYFYVSIITTLMMENNFIASFFHSEIGSFYYFNVALAIWPILNLQLKPIENLTFLLLLTISSILIMEFIEIKPFFLLLNIIIYSIMVLIKRKKDIFFITENFSLLIIFILNNFFFLFGKHPNLWHVHNAFSSFVRPLWLSLLCYFYLTIIFRYGKFKHLL